jgi:peptidoglycan/LPS O-acetylase OafA/YrhL
MAIRLIRLYPLYLLALILSLVLAQREISHGEIGLATLMPSLFAAILFVPSPTSSLLFPLNMPAWSLFFELAVNTVFALTRRRVGDFLLIIIVMAAAVVLASATISGCCGFGRPGYGAMDAGNHWDGLGAGAIRVAFSFFAGVLVYRAWKIWHLGFRIPPTLVMVALAAVLVAHPAENYQPAFDLAATLVVFPALIFLGACSVPTGSLARLFSTIGAASYAIYVLQAPLYEIAHRMALSLSRGSLPEVPWTILGLAFETLLLGVATLANRYFDKPLREALSTRLLVSYKTTAEARSI